MTAGSQTGITRTIAIMTVRQVLGLRRFIMLGLLALAPAVVLFFAAARTNDAGPHRGVRRHRQRHVLRPGGADHRPGARLVQPWRGAPGEDLVVPRAPPGQPEPDRRRQDARRLRRRRRRRRPRRRGGQPGDGVRAEAGSDGCSPPWSVGWWGRRPTSACSSRWAIAFEKATLIGLAVRVHLGDGGGGHAARPVRHLTVADRAERLRRAGARDSEAVVERLHAEQRRRRRRRRRRSRPWSSSPSAPRSPPGCWPAATTSDRRRHQTSLPGESGDRN